MIHAHPHIGNATRECVNNNSWETPNVSQCRTIELIRLQAQARNLSNSSQQNGQKSMAMKNDTVENLEMLLSITADTNNVINSTYPILPSDICSVVNILRNVLKYVYLFKSTSLCNKTLLTYWVPLPHVQVIAISN